MRSRGKGFLRIILAFTLVLGLCGTLVFGLMLIKDTPAVLETIGPPATDLNPIQQTLLAIFLLGNGSSLDRPAGDWERVIEFQVEEGQTAANVLDTLQSSGVIQNEFLLRYYLQYRGIDRQIEAGRYKLAGSMTVREIAQALQRALPSQSALTVREGWRWEQIAEELSRLSPSFSPMVFEQLISTVPPGYSFSETIPPGGTLEGFFFPDTYLIEPETTAEEILQRVLANFEAKLTPVLLEGFNQRGLNLHQGVTLASIIEREAIVPDEQDLIASVFLNRLALGMQLDADPTIQYALGRQPDGSWWKAPLTLQDLELDSPYNTYLYGGLPPGPISNPGLGALEAVAFPKDTPYLYFRATCDDSGRHAFAVTFEEHLANECPP